MATRVPVQENNGQTVGYVVWKYTSVGAGDTCSPIEVGHYKELMVQSVSGSWGTKKVTWKGTLFNDGSNMLPLTDSQSGSGLEHNAADGLDEVLQIPRMIEPVISGTGGTAITILVLGKLKG